MVLIIDGESYGWLHKAFFFLSGFSASIFFATMYSSRL